MTEQLLVPAGDAAKMLGMSRSFFYENLSSGRIPLTAIRFGKKRLYEVERIKSFVKSGCSAKWIADNGNGKTD